MSTILMMFILPIGIIIYFWDRKNYRQNIALFEEYIEKMRRADFDDAQRMQRIDTMFYENGYRTVQKETTRLTVEKKHFNIGLLFIFFGLMNYFGIFIYIIVYRFFQKPRRLCVSLTAEPSLQHC